MYPYINNGYKSNRTRKHQWLYEFHCWFLWMMLVFGFPLKCTIMIILFHLITSARYDILVLSKSIPIPPEAALFAFLQADEVINVFPKTFSMRVSSLCTIV